MNEIIVYFRQPIQHPNALRSLIALHTEEGDLEEGDSTYYAHDHTGKFFVFVKEAVAYYTVMEMKGEKEEKEEKEHWLR